MTKDNLSIRQPRGWRPFTRHNITCMKQGPNTPYQYAMVCFESNLHKEQATMFFSLKHVHIWLYECCDKQQGNNLCCDKHHGIYVLHSLDLWISLFQCIGHGFFCSFLSLEKGLKNHSWDGACLDVLSFVEWIPKFCFNKSCRLINAGNQTTALNIFEPPSIYHPSWCKESLTLNLSVSFWGFSYILVSNFSGEFQERMVRCRLSTNNLQFVANWTLHFLVDWCHHNMDWIAMLQSMC